MPAPPEEEEASDSKTKNDNKNHIPDPADFKKKGGGRAKNVAENKQNTLSCGILPGVEEKPRGLMNSSSSSSNTRKGTGGDEEIAPKTTQIDIKTSRKANKSNTAAHLQVDVSIYFFLILSIFLVLISLCFVL